jgi:hypothetical protein
VRPRFETVDGRQLLFLEGRQFFMLAADLPWYQSPCGRYHETMGDWGYLCPVVRKMYLNTFKVAVEWFQVEPQKDFFDFSYVDYVRALADANGLKLILGLFGHYASIERAVPAIALCVGADKLEVFLDGESRAAEVAGTKVTRELRSWWAVDGSASLPKRVCFDRLEGVGATGIAAGPLVRSQESAGRGRPMRRLALDTVSQPWFAITRRTKAKRCGSTCFGDR